ncbi:AMP-binding protein [Desulfatibacillum aliphaticivorans]|uniref:AMP-binding protein n=1 Tax=Desulfatibacillum aliphaticivorans TaxID=218208 RepID=UPI0004802D2D|nr:AMP-binding protein [Desulfatibacillum aliphaticivorans]
MDIKREDMAGLFYTGGATGRSKGVMLAHFNLCYNALQMCHERQDPPHSAHVSPGGRHPFRDLDHKPGGLAPPIFWVAHTRSLTLFDKYM